MNIKDEPADHLSDTEIQTSTPPLNSSPARHLDMMSNRIKTDQDVNLKQNGDDIYMKLEVDMKSNEVKTDFDRTWNNFKKHFYDDQTINLYQKNFELNGCSSVRKNRHIKISPMRNKMAPEDTNTELDLSYFRNLNKELQITIVNNKNKPEKNNHSKESNTTKDLDTQIPEFINTDDLADSHGVLLTGLSEAFYEDNNEESLNTWMNHKFVTEEGLFSYNDNQFESDHVYNTSDFFSCGLCEFTCKTPAQLKSHDVIHTQPFQCNECPYKFRYLSHLKQHQLIHNNIKPFSCSECNFKCKRTSELRTHKIIHSDAKPYVCGICQFRCKRLNELKKHKMIHNSEKPFSCDECDFKCRQSCHLRRHKMIHNDEKPFACHLCSFKCRTSSNLKTHSFIHNNLKPFVCGTCEFKCRTSGNLKKHQTIHKAPTVAD